MWLLTLKSVLIATDLDGASRAALRTGTRLASLAGAGIHLLHVADEPTLEAEDRLTTEFTAAVPDPPEPASLLVVVGTPAEAIVKRAAEIGAEAIVLGPHRRPASAASAGGKLGSTAASVVRTAPCPCLVAATELRLPLERIIVPIDLSEIAGGALSVAVSWASALRPRGGDAQLIVLYVAPESEARDAAQRVREEVRRVRADAGGAARVQIREVIVPGTDPAAEILRRAEAESADLVVMGTRGVADAAVGLGSVSTAVVRATQVPLLLVPQAPRPGAVPEAP